MAPFLYAADNSRESHSALRDPNADPAISEFVSSVLDSDLEIGTGRRPSDSDHDPGPEHEAYLSAFEELYSLEHSLSSPSPQTIDPNQQMPSMPFTSTHGHRQVTPSTDSLASNSSSSVANLAMRNASSRKRKSADPIFSSRDPAHSSAYLSRQDLEHRSSLGSSSNLTWEQNTNDTVNGMSKLYMESADVSPSSSLNSVSASQYGLPGVSIPNFVRQDSSVSISSFPGRLHTSR